MRSLPNRLAVSILVVAAAVVAAASARAQAPAAPAKQPKVEIADPVYDYGTAYEGQFVSHVFEIKNAGTAPLDIRGVRTSCGCTTGAPSKDHLMPGEVSDLQVTFDTRSQKGHKVRTISVFTNDPQSPSSVVTLQGNVKVQVEAEPSEINFDKVKLGGEASREVTITDLNGGKDFKVGPVTNSSPFIKVTQVPRKDGKQGAMVEVALVKGMPIGQFDDTVNIMTNRQPIQVHIFGQITGDLNLDPAQVSFGIVAHAQSVVRYLKLSNQGSKPVQITGITTTNPSVAAKFEPVTPGKEYKITVELRRNTPDGQLSGQVAIHTDDVEQPTLTVPFYAILGKFEG